MLCIYVMAVRGVYFCFFLYLRAVPKRLPALYSPTACVAWDGDTKDERKRRSWRANLLIGRGISIARRCIQFSFWIQHNMETYTFCQRQYDTRTRPQPTHILECLVIRKDRKSVKTLVNCILVWVCGGTYLFLFLHLRNLSRCDSRFLEWQNG